MGLFDGVKAGWDSFQKNELKAYADTWKTIYVDTPKKVIEAVDQGLKESSQPIWERDSTKEILGEDGADKLQDTLNPARWAENTIDRTPLSPENQESLKKYLPIAAIGAGALLLLAALK